MCTWCVWLSVWVCMDECMGVYVVCMVECMGVYG